MKRSRIDVGGLVSEDGEVQDRRIYWDQDIYALELERIFARSWLFLAHENSIPKSGDFVTTFMGQDRVIVTRGKDGKINAFTNACRHRGNLLCAADSGNSRSFVGSYHVWTYGLDGSLLNVPLESEAYYSNIDKSQWGARKVRVENYRGFLFGTYDPAAPSFAEYLGDVAWHIDSFMHVPGGARHHRVPGPRGNLQHSHGRRRSISLPHPARYSPRFHRGWVDLRSAASALSGGHGVV